MILVIDFVIIDLFNGGVFPIFFKPCKIIKKSFNKRKNTKKKELPSI
jgi:hypothetical protein